MTVSNFAFYMTPHAGASHPPGTIMWTGTMTAPEAPLVALNNPGLAWIAVDGPLSGAGHYVDLAEDPVVLPRPILPGFGKTEIAADGTDAARVVLGEPFTVIVDGQSYLINETDADGDYVLEITSAMPATYKVAIQHFPYLDFEAEITAS